MAIIDILGFVGMILLLSAFILNQVNWLPNDSATYQIFNLVGAYLLTWYAYVLGNTPFIILEFVWGSFALYKLIGLSVAFGRTT